VQILVSGGAYLTVGKALVTLGAGIALAIAGSAAARLASTRRAMTAEVSEGRRTVVRERPPVLRRYYLDFGALALSGLLYWMTIQTGFSAVINPDSNPTLSLSVYMFFGPALLWIGATLLLVRLRGRFMSVLARRAARRPGSLAGMVVASVGRRAAAVNRGLVVIGLLLAFAVSLGALTAAYH